VCTLPHSCPSPCETDHHIIASIEKILNLNHDQLIKVESNANANGVVSTSNPPLLTEDGEPIWKVLVFDNFGRDVISSVLRVQDLRNFGVTIHLNLHSPRHPIPDVPVVYLVEPTSENINAISADLSNNLYETAYVNFLSSVPRPLLEDFAALTAQNDTSGKIAQVYDQYLNFVVSEPDLFSLHLKDAYYTLNSAQAADSAIESTIDRIVGGLFSVVVTMGRIASGVACGPVFYFLLLRTVALRPWHRYIHNSAPLGCWQLMRPPCVRTVLSDFRFHSHHQVSQG
jgi:hypothetical protein